MLIVRKHPVVELDCSDCKACIFCRVVGRPVVVHLRELATSLVFGALTMIVSSMPRTDSPQLYNALLLFFRHVVLSK